LGGGEKVVVFRVACKIPASIAQARRLPALTLHGVGHLLAVSFLVLLGGCASDAEDRAFFNRGWMKPEAGANQRMMPEHY
jgi:hypothetical protein